MSALRELPMDDRPHGLLRRLHGRLMPDYNLRAAIYWWVMVLLGSAVIVAAAGAVAGRGPAVLLQLVAGCCGAVVAAYFPIRIPGSKYSFATAEIFVFVLLLRAGPEAATLAAATEALVASCRTSRRWTSRLVSPAIAALAMAVAGGGFQAFVDTLQERGLNNESSMIVWLTLLAVAYFVLSTWPVRLVMLLKGGGRLRLSDLLDGFGWVATSYCANALIASLLYLAALQAGAVVLLAALPIIGLLLSTLHFHFRQREAEAERGRALVAAAEREAALASRHLQELRRIADHDALTSLVNRRRFLECLADAFERWQADRTLHFAVMYLDFDGFKRINDTLGHAAGDEFLVHVSQRIQQQVRQMDLVGRLGGDEFAILVRDIATEQQVTQLARRMQEALRKPYAMAGTEVISSASIGITFSHFGYETPDAMLRDADEAMYQAKSQGRARHVVHDRSTQAGATGTHS